MTVYSPGSRHDYYIRTRDRDRAKKNAYSRQYSLDHYEEQRAKQGVHLANRAAQIDALKNGPCVDCGGRFPAVAMDFDHLDSSDKRWSISGAKNRKWSDILAEIDKCELVCANCHRVRTHTLRPHLGGRKRNR